MTLELYSPEKLDRLALQLFDLAATVRQMATHCREHEIADLPLHDKKALEWSAKLDHWVQKAQAEVALRVRQAVAERRAGSSNTAVGRSDGLAEGDE